MKKILLILTMLTAHIGSMWADLLPNAVVGTYAFRDETLITGNSGHTITKDEGGNITISPNNNGYFSNNTSEFKGTIVIKINVPETTTANVLCEMRKSSDVTTSAQGLYMKTGRELTTSWEGGSRTVEMVKGSNTTLSAGEHTIIYIASSTGAWVVVDATDNLYFKDTSLKKSDVEYKAIYIPAAYAQYITEVYFFSDAKSDADKGTIFNECSNYIHSSSHKSTTDVSGKVLIIDDDAQLSTFTSASNTFVARGKKLTVNVSDFDLTKISGTGDVILASNTSITGSKSTVATGKLTINEGCLLTIGDGDSETNSIESFTNIELAGTIKHKNSTATLNNVTVPSGKTGKIHAYDMNETTDGFKLAGTTTLNGKLIVSNTYNFLIKVDELVGTNEWEIRGTNWADEDFNYIHTESLNPAVVNVASASSFTGTVNVNNSKATVTISGNLVASTIKKTNGILKYAGTNLNGTTIKGAVLTGSTYVTTSGDVTVEDLAGNEVQSSSNTNTHHYAFVGSGDNCKIIFKGTCDLTKKSDGSTSNENAKVGYNSNSSIEIENNANVTVVALFNSETNNNNAAITVKDGATVTCTGTSNYLWSTSLQGSGNIVLSAFPSESTHPIISNDWTGTIEFPDGGSSSTNLTNIFNAWGNSNSTIKINNVQGYFLNTIDKITIPTLDILYGKTLTLNNGSSGADAYLSKVTGAGTVDRQKWGSATNHNLIINNLIGFTGTLNGSGFPILVTNLVLTSEPAVDALLFKTSGTVTFDKTSSSSKLYIGNDNKTDAYAWEEKTVDEVKGYYITESAPAKIDAAKKSVSTRTIGTSVGEYAVSFDGYSYTDKDAFESAVNDLTTLDDWTDVTDPAFTINQPTSGFYRIKSSSIWSTTDTYLTSTNSASDATRCAFTQNENDIAGVSTILYYNNGLLSYPTGYWMSSGYRAPWNTGVGTGSTVTFQAAANGSIGKYNIKFVYRDGDTTSDRYLYTDKDNLYSDSGSGNPSGSNKEGYNFELKEVTSLPVTFKKAGLGYATFCPPVAVKIPDGVSAFVSKINGNKISLFKIENITDNDDDVVIPANTAVMLYKEGGVLNEDGDVVSFTISDYNGEGITGNGFSGTIATETQDGESTYYALRPWKASADAEVSRVGFTAMAGNSTLAGFKAWIRDEQPARNFTIVFEGDSDPTGIVEALGIEDANVDIYDLNGRKLQSIQKGVNIVNGKKIIK